MEEIKDGVTLDNVGCDAAVAGNEYLPVKPESFWANFKAFWLQEVEQDNFWFKPIVVTTTPKQAETLGKIKAFWLQEIKWK